MSMTSAVQQKCVFNPLNWFGGGAGRKSLRANDGRKQHRASLADSAGETNFRYVNGPRVIERKIAFIASGDSPLKDHAAWVGQHANGMETYETLPQFAAKLDPLLQKIYAAVVDVDVLARTGASLETLIDLRNRFPDLIVVTASRNLNRHDFTGDRIAIADASVRLPASRISLGLALSAAATNNLARLLRGQEAPI